MFPNDTTQPEIPYGYCHCGCGQKTEISTTTRTKKNAYKGKPLPFVKFHRRIPSIEDRFWKNSNPSPEDGCWVWTGLKDDDGYGKIIQKKKSYFAHRVSWIIFFGEIPEKLFVCHNCPEGKDNPSCVNPKHLFLGTHFDNMRDMVNKGRSCYGEKNVRAKLNPEKVLYIRHQYSKKLKSVRELAREMGVGNTTIQHIIQGDSWRSVK